MIRLEHVNKYFNRHRANEIHVINDTSLELPDQGLVTLLGPSGCGKTTLLNAVGGLDKINSGKIFVDGDRIAKRRAGKIDKIRNAKIGYIFQNFNLLDDKSVYDNVALALRMVGMKNEDQIRERVNYCLDAVNIYRFRNKPAGALSGGQRQRVAIARAIVKNPRIIIADEPTGNLDSANTLEVMNIIKTISRERLVLLVTHEEKIANFYSDRIIRIRDGKILSDESNEAGQKMDYELENRIYLKDLPVERGVEDEQADVKVYSDGSQDLKGIRLVVRGGNLYIDTGGKYNVIDEASNVELIDDHYTQLDRSVFEQNRFRYDAHMPENFRPKYQSLYGPVSSLRDGFRTLAHFRALKKFLLVGFFFAACFAFFGVSRIAGTTHVTPEKYLTTNRHYITVTNTQKNLDTVKLAATAQGAAYAIPGNSVVSFSLPLNDYYQTANVVGALSGSLTDVSKLPKSRLAAGRLPQNDHEIVVDRLVLKNFIRAKTGASIGLTKPKQFLGRTVKVPHLADFTIVGISKTHSPSIFVNADQFTYILPNAESGSTEGGVNDMGDGTSVDDSTDEDTSGTLTDYSLASGLTIKTGSAPKNAYEVVLNETHKKVEQKKIMKKVVVVVDKNGNEVSDEELRQILGDDAAGDGSVSSSTQLPDGYRLVTKEVEDTEAEEQAAAEASAGAAADQYKLNEYLDRKINGQKLKIVGFYTSTRLNDDAYYVSHETFYERYVLKQSKISVYSDQPDRTAESLNELGFRARVNAERDREKYDTENRESVRSAIIMAAIAIGISLIEIFLMLRSSFLSRIREVGTLRAIGVKKRDIYRMFSGEIFAITLVTSVPAIALMYYILYRIMKTSAMFAGSYRLNPQIALLTFAGMLLFNLIVGLIPVWRTMRKTPAAILARSDI